MSTSLGPRTGRLPAGELRARVLAAVTAHPDRAWSVIAVTKAIGARSAGAVGNALGHLARCGHLEQLPGTPRSYRAAATTATAASTTPIPPSPPLAPVVGTTGAVPRPGGGAYHPRRLAGRADVDALRALRAADIPALLYGPPGTGKTALAEAAFPDLLTVAGDGDTAVADLVGDYTQTADGRYEFVPGPLPVAMAEGRCLFVDDATLISPKVLAVVYPAMDGRRQIAIKAHRGQIVTAAPGFYVIAGHNPGVHGAVLTDALASRFAAQIHIPTDYQLAAVLGVPANAVLAAKQLRNRMAAGEIGWAPQLRELLAFARIADVLGPDAAVANLVGTAPVEDRELVREVVSKVFGYPVDPLSVGRRI
ncbi:MAG: AAA family ATPase [Sporichthyaceae bacterium]|nr:AAA family ATPase [Sporichthyaceae bacterium]